jgi:hypothetical protein
MIAISYRREDSTPVAGRLQDRLRAEFGVENVFMDFDSIPYGVDFREHIKRTLERADVVVAVVGPAWLGQQGDVSRRIDDASDFVRLEIAGALQRGIPVIPILVDNTPMPKPDTLPADIQGFAFRNALVLDTGIDFHHHADRLIAGIRKLLNDVPETPGIPRQESKPAHEKNALREDQQSGAKAEQSKWARILDRLKATTSLTKPKEEPSSVEPSTEESAPKLKRVSRAEKPRPAPITATLPQVARAPMAKGPHRFGLNRKRIVMACLVVLLVVCYFGIMLFGDRMWSNKAAKPVSESTPVPSATATETVTPLVATTTATSPPPMETGSQLTNVPVTTGNASGSLQPSKEIGTETTPFISSDQTPAPPASPEIARANPVTQDGPSGKNGRTWQTWIGEFVRQFVSANQLKDANATLAFYAPRVDYFDDRWKDQAYVRSDIEKYNERWPLRRDSIEGDIHLQEKVPDKKYVASFKLNFYAESAPRAVWTKGQFAIDLDISVVDGIPRISGIKEKMLHQQKGKPNPAMPNSPTPATTQGSGFTSPVAPAQSEAGFCSWMANDNGQFNSFFDQQNDAGSFPVLIEGRLHKGVWEYRAIFVTKPVRQLAYYSCWGYSPRKYEQFKSKLKAAGYDILSQQTFDDVVANKIYQTVWVRSDQMPAAKECLKRTVR